MTSATLPALVAVVAVPDGVADAVRVGRVDDPVVAAPRVVREQRHRQPRLGAGNLGVVVEDARGRRGAVDRLGEPGHRGVVAHRVAAVAVAVHLLGSPGLAVGEPDRPGQADPRRAQVGRVDRRGPVHRTEATLGIELQLTGVELSVAVVVDEVRHRRGAEVELVVRARAAVGVVVAGDEVVVGVLGLADVGLHDDVAEPVEAERLWVDWAGAPPGTSPPPPGWRAGRSSDRGTRRWWCRRSG